MQLGTFVKTLVLARPVHGWLTTTVSTPYRLKPMHGAVVPEEVVELEEERSALSVFERLSRSLTFYSRVIPILARYQLKNVELRRRCATDEECDVEYAELDQWGSDRLRDTILELQGFYVKSGQVISSRVDLFSQPYTEKLAVLQDGLEPISTEIVKAVIRSELSIESLDELFRDFDDVPLGCASIAQVHKATLLDGRQVAVKVQRPGARPLLLADLANLKRFSKLLADALPVDYYTVFSELGEALDGELDFLNEANSMEKLRAEIATPPGGQKQEDDPPVRVPRAIPGLSSRKVLVMDFVEGVPLKRLAETSKFDPESPEAKYAGAKIVTALGEAYARMVFNGGHVHGDPHPANIFVDPATLDVTLLDCGQTKQLSIADRAQLRSVILRLQAYRRDPTNPTTLRALADDIKDFGVQLRPREITTPNDDALEETAAKIQEEDDANCLASIALLLFGDKSLPLPGGYDDNELGPNSPLKRLASFPQSLVLLGRAAVLIRGIAAKLKVPYSLADAWEDAADRAALAESPLPPWSIVPQEDTTSSEVTSKDVWRTVRSWMKSKGRRVVRVLPPRVQTFLAARAVRRLEQRLAS